MPNRPARGTTEIRLQQQLKVAHSQLDRLTGGLAELKEELYAKGVELIQVRRQAEAYAVDLNRLLDAERQGSAELHRAYTDTIERLASATTLRDQETGAHLQRIGRYVLKLASAFGVAEDEAESMSVAAALHDVGKIAIPDSILRKPGPLDESEREIVQSHTTIGARMLDGSPSPRLTLARQIAWTHHENWDSSGYPRGLAAEEIPLSGRIVKIADQYDALRNKRSYKPSLDHERACHVILCGDARSKPTHFDPRLLEVFAKLHPEFEAVSRQFEERSGGTAS